MGAFDILFEKNLFKIKRYGPGARDPLGKPTETLLSETLADGILMQTGSDEGETFVVDEFRAVMSIDTDLRAKDRVEVRGDLFTVEGRPFSARAPGSRSIGVVTAILKYVGPAEDG